MGVAGEALPLRQGAFRKTLRRGALLAYRHEVIRV